jgi:hypothetical protein
MKRTPLARKTPLRAHSQLKRAPMRKRSRKSSPVRQSAQGECCTLNFTGCPNDTSTVVLAHLRMFHGGGAALKPSDGEAVFADFYCHERLDGRVPWLREQEGFDFWESIARALVKTHRILRARGLMTLKGEAA